MAYTAIDDPSAYFQAKIYTGTQQSHAITFDGNSDMQPDWVWIKCRDDTHNHQLFDAVRGVHNRLRSDTDGTPTTSNESLKSFDSDGFTLGTQQNVNASANNDNSFVSWSWKAGGGSGSANTDGSIDTESTSVSTTAGFSISKYTGNATNGATVGHGLGVVPDMIIGKDLSDTSAWCVWHKDLTNAGYRLTLSTTAAQSDDTALFGGSSRTAPTSTVFSLGSGGGLNGSNDNLVYCFTSIQGYSKFGSYSGNGNADGPYIHTGFRPAFTMIKRIDSTNDWMMGDNKITTFNPKDGMMRANLSNVELSTNPVDYLANGFKIRLTGNAFNNSSGTYIFMAFAENPFVTSEGVPGNAG